MQEFPSATSGVLDPDTVLQMHRLASPTASPPGLIGDALAAGRLDVLDILHAAGELARGTVAADCYAKVLDKRDLAGLGWLIAKGLKPSRSKDAEGPMWLGLQAATKGGLWQEGLIQLLEAGILGVNDRLARDFDKPYSLLQFALTNKGDAFACELLVNGARADAEDMLVAVRTGCFGAVGLIAPQIDNISLAQLWSMRCALDDGSTVPGLKTPQELDDRVRAILLTAVDALAARALDASERSSRSSVWGKDFAAALNEFKDEAQIRAIVRRHPAERDELLRCACRDDAFLVAKVLLQEGARLDATDGGRLPVVLPRYVGEREYSPHALHNAMSARIMRLVLEHGADLHVEWQGKKVLHWTIENFKGKREESTIARAKGVIDFLAEQGVDFAEGANGRSVKQLGATLCDDLKRHLMAIRTGDRIAAAMADCASGDGGVDKPAAKGLSGVL